MSGKIKVLTIREPIRHHNAPDDSQLLQSHKRTTDFRRGKLGIIQWDDHRKRADTNTRNEPTCENVVVGSTVSEGLNDYADCEDAASDHDAKLPT